MIGWDYEPPQREQNGDPATQEWRQALGESTSAQLRQTQAALAASQADLTHVEGQLADAERDRMKAEQERDELTRLLLEARQALTVAEKHDDCAWKTLAAKAAAERDKARAQLVEANSTVLRTGGQIYPARQDVGPCVLCGRPIVRGHAVEARNDGTTKPQWVHAVCPDPVPTKES